VDSTTDRRLSLRMLVKVLAALSVIASLGFVALEIRQNTAVVKMAAIQDMASVTSEYLNA